MASGLNGIEVGGVRGWGLCLSKTPATRLQLDHLTDSIAFYTPKDGPLTAESKIGRFQGLFYFKAKVTIGSETKWVLINRWSAHKWLSKQGVSCSILSVASTFFGYVQKREEICEGLSEEQQVLITPEVHRLIDEMGMESKGEILSALQVLFSTRAELDAALKGRGSRYFALQLLVVWGRHVREAPGDKRAELKGQTKEFLSFARRRMQTGVHSLDHLISSFEAAPLLKHAQGYADLTQDECEELIAFIKERQETLTFPEGKEYYLFRPRETGLARSVLFFKDGTVVIQFNRMKRGDKVLGSGTFSSVKVGYDVTHSRLVALSTTQGDDYIQDTVPGYIAAARMQPSEHVVSLGQQYVKRSKRHDEKKFIVVMELVPGQNLWQHFNQWSFRFEGTIQEGRKWACELLEGLMAIHNDGVIHSDIKEANIVIGEDSTLKIVDFGLSRAASEDGMAIDLSLKGGSPAYAPPELPALPTHQKDDVWAAGGVIWNLLEKDVKSYFKQPSFQEIWLEALRRGPPDESADELAGRVHLEMRSEGWLLREGLKMEALRAEAAVLGNYGAKKALLIAEMLSPREQRPTAEQAHERLSAILEAEGAAGIQSVF